MRLFPSLVLFSASPNSCFSSHSYSPPSPFTPLPPFFHTKSIFLSFLPLSSISASIPYVLFDGPIIEFCFFVQKTCNVLHIIRLPGIHTVNTITCVKDFIWIGSTSGVIFIYDLATANYLYSWGGHESPVETIVQIKDHVWSLDSSGSYLVWLLTVPPSPFLISPFLFYLFCFAYSKTNLSALEATN